MKIRVISLCVCLLACFGCLNPVAAQVRFGIKGGLNLANLCFTRHDFDVEDRLGYFVGPMIDWKIPLLGLGVEVSALYSETGSVIKDGETASEPVASVSVPLRLKLSFGIGKLCSLYAAAGPQFDLNISEMDLTKDLKLQEYNTSFNVGAGIKYTRHYQIGINYNFNLTPVAETIDKEVGMDQYIWQVSLAYLF